MRFTREELANPTCCSSGGKGTAQEKHVNSLKMLQGIVQSPEFEEQYSKGQPTALSAHSLSLPVVPDSHPLLPEVHQALEMSQRRGNPELTRLYADRLFLPEAYSINVDGVPKGQHAIKHRSTGKIVALYPSAREARAQLNDPDSNFRKDLEEYHVRLINSSPTLKVSDTDHYLFHLLGSGTDPLASGHFPSSGGPVTRRFSPSVTPNPRNRSNLRPSEPMLDEPLVQRVTPLSDITSVDSEGNTTSEVHPILESLLNTVAKGTPAGWLNPVSGPAAARADVRKRESQSEEPKPVFYRKIISSLQKYAELVRPHGATGGDTLRPGICDICDKPKSGLTADPILETTFAVDKDGSTVSKDRVVGWHHPRPLKPSEASPDVCLGQDEEGKCVHGTRKPNLIQDLGLGPRGHGTSLTQNLRDYQDFGLPQSLHEYMEKKGLSLPENFEENIAERDENGALRYSGRQVYDTLYRHLFSHLADRRDGNGKALPDLSHQIAQDTLRGHFVPESQKRSVADERGITLDSTSQRIRKNLEPDLVKTLSHHYTTNVSSQLRSEYPELSQGLPPHLAPYAHFDRPQAGWHGLWEHLSGTMRKQDPSLTDEDIKDTLIQTTPSVEELGQARKSLERSYIAPRAPKPKTRDDVGEMFPELFPEKEKDRPQVTPERRTQTNEQLNYGPVPPELVRSRATIKPEGLTDMWPSSVGKSELGPIGWHWPTQPGHVPEQALQESQMSEPQLKLTDEEWQKLRAPKFFSTKGNK